MVLMIGFAMTEFANTMYLFSTAEYVFLRLEILRFGDLGI